MELLGVIKSLEALKKPCDITMYSDSQYVVKGVSLWLSSWIRNGWVRGKHNKPVLNRDMWEKIWHLQQKHSLDMLWVKGHSGNEDNERCDVLAKQAAKRGKPYADINRELNRIIPDAIAG
jgi:ribonuclease HI